MLADERARRWSAARTRRASLVSQCQHGLANLAGANVVASPELRIAVQARCWGGIGYSSRFTPGNMVAVRARADRLSLSRVGASPTAWLASSRDQASAIFDVEI